MADVRISALPAASALAGTEPLPIVQSSDTVQTTAQDVANLAPAPAFSAVTSKPTTLSGYGITDGVATTRTVSTTAPLTGGGDLSANRTIAIPAATGSVDGYATATQITKLNGIASGATANSSDATLLARANHTGTQLSSTISDFTAAVATAARLYTSGALVDVNNTTTKTALCTVPIPAGQLGTNNFVDVELNGSYLNNSGATKTITLEVVYGSTVMFSGTSAALTAGATRHPFKMRCRLSAQNSASSQFMCGLVTMGDLAPPATGMGDMSGAITAAKGVNTPIAGTATESSASALNFVVNITHSAAASTVSMQINHTAATVA